MAKRFILTSFRIINRITHYENEMYQRKAHSDGLFILEQFKFSSKIFLKLTYYKSKSLSDLLCKFINKK